MDSLDVLLVIPIEYDKNRKVVHAYKRIKVEDLSKNGISDLYLNLNFKRLPCCCKRTPSSLDKRNRG